MRSTPPPPDCTVIHYSAGTEISPKLTPPPSLLPLTHSFPSPACIVRDEGARVHHRNQGVQLQPVHHGVPRSHRLGKLVADVLRLRNPAVLKDDPEEENATIKQSRGARAQSACW